jgi:biopolymer transport protein ExbB
VILAFEALGDAGAVSGASQAASSQVMSAIAEALVATAVGIGVALPAVALYNYFQRRLAGIMSDAEALSSLVVAYLEDETIPSAASDDVEREPPEAAAGANDSEPALGPAPTRHAREAV